MKFFICYNDKNITFEEMLPNIAQSHGGEVIDSDFFKGETTISLVLPNEGNFANFLEDAKRLGAKFNLKVSPVGSYSIDL